ncbi:MAG: hypothetical protein ACTSV3_08435 [Candidatus Thorarchaeota archaeon]
MFTIGRGIRGKDPVHDSLPPYVYLREGEILKDIGELRVQRSVRE